MQARISLFCQYETSAKFNAAHRVCNLATPWRNGEVCDEARLVMTLAAREISYRAYLISVISISLSNYQRCAYNVRENQYVKPSNNRRARYNAITEKGSIRGAH